MRLDGTDATAAVVNVHTAPALEPLALLATTCQLYAVDPTRLAAGTYLLAVTVAVGVAGLLCEVAHRYTS